MLSDTLASGLEQYRIGPKIKELRQKKGLGLAQLAGHTGLSSALLSKIERGRLFPTLPTLLRIALVFGVGLEHFFVETGERPMVAVTRKKDRVRLPERVGDKVPSFFFESLDFPATDRKLDAYYVEFPVGSEQSQPHEHEGAELIYVLKGQLIVKIGGGDIVLHESDSMYFDSGATHSYRGDGRATCSAIIVVVP